MILKQYIVKLFGQIKLHNWSLITLLTIKYDDYIAQNIEKLFKIEIGLK